MLIYLAIRTAVHYARVRTNAALSFSPLLGLSTEEHVAEVAVLESVLAEDGLVLLTEENRFARRVLGH